MKPAYKLCLSAAILLVAAATASGQSTDKIDRAKIPAENLQRPETTAFILMRNLEGTEPGTASFKLREQINRWRVLAKDKQRKLGTKWLSQDDIARKRIAFITRLREADEKFLEAKRLRGKKEKDQNKRKQIRNAGFLKLQQAAGIWADPKLRGFLRGVAYYQAGKFGKAATAFRKSRTSAPRVAAFSQGHGMTLLELNRHMDALEAFIQVCHLRPESQDARNLLKKGVEAAPGSRLRSPTYIKAHKLLEQLSDQTRRRTSSRRGINWLLPGKDASTRGEGLPTLPYDRLEFMQAVGVPVGKSALLVDSKIVIGASEVFVQIDENTIVPGKVVRLSRSGQTSPVTAVTVSGYTFTPVVTDGDLSERQPVMAYGLSALAEMGKKTTKLPGRITLKKDGTLDVGIKLAPGEAASPVIGDDNRLVGFLANKADVMVEGGGPDKLITLADMEKILKKAAAAKPRRSRRNSTAKPIAVKGSYFVIHATFVEFPE